MSNPSGPIRDNVIRVLESDWNELYAIKKRIEVELNKTEDIIQWVEKSLFKNVNIPIQMVDEHTNATVKHNELSRYLGIKQKYEDLGEE